MQSGVNGGSNGIYNEDYLFSLQVDLKPLREAAVAVPAPKIPEKRKAEDADASKDLKKVNIFGLFAPAV